MKTEFSITCTKENLLVGLSRVAAIAGRNKQLPILQHILLQSKNGVLHLTSTDLELGVHTVVGGKTTSNGSATIPARSLLGYIQQLPGDNPIHLAIKQGAAHITTTGFSAQFPTGNPDDFPILPQGNKDQAITLSGNSLCRALQQVVFAAARDETRPEIRGVYIQTDDTTVRLAATDSFRLAEEVIPHSGKGEATCILPLTCAQEVMRLFSGEAEVMIAPQDSHILVYSDEIDVSSRLIDGSYPDYRQIIPQSSKTVVTIPRDELLRALKTLTVFLPRDSRRVELDVRPQAGTLTARVTGVGVGEGMVEVPLEGQGEPHTVLMNIQYLLEGLQHIVTAKCVVGLGGDASPIVIRPEGTATTYVYVVMPIRS